MADQRAAARAELARRELARRGAPATQPERSSPAAAAGFGRGGRAPSPETMAAMRNADIGTAASAAAAGFNRGVVDLAGLPMDTATNVADLAGMAYGASRAAISDRPAGEFFEPYDRSQVPGTSEYIASKLAPTTLGAGIAPPSPDATGANALYNISRFIPGATSGRQVLASGASGGAATIAGSLGADPATQAVAGLLGGRGAEVLPPIVPRPKMSGFGPDSASAAAAMPPQLSRVPQELRGPLVQALQRGERDTAMRVIDAETLPVPVRLTEGQARADSALMADEFNMRGTDKELGGRFDEQNQALIENLDTIRREVSPNVVGNDHVQNGQALIDAYKAYDEPIRAEITAKYQALEEANGGQLPVNAQSFVNAADNALAKKLKGRYLPSAIKGDLDQFRDNAGQMTFEQFENLRTNLATEARKADRAGDGNASAAINIVRRELENMPMEGVGADLKKLADDARAAAKARFDALDADPAYRAAVDDDTPPGELSAFADDFVKKYVVNGKAANLKRMRGNLAGDPQAAEAVAAAALNYVKSKSGVNLYTNEGNFSQAGFNRALQEITPRIEALLPNEAAELLQQLGRVAHDVQRQRKGGNFNNSGTAGALIKEGAKGYGETVLNTVIPGAQIGTTVRKHRSASRDRARVQRSLDPRRYLTADE